MHEPWILLLRVVVTVDEQGGYARSRHRLWNAATAATISRAIQKEHEWQQY